MQGTQYATKRSILCRGAFCGPTLHTPLHIYKQFWFGILYLFQGGRRGAGGGGQKMRHCQCAIIISGPRKAVFGVSDIARLKPTCLATETS